MSQVYENSGGGSGSGVVDFLEGNTGGPVGPNNANTIFILGSGGISVTGSAGTNTLTISNASLAAWNKISSSQTLAVNNGYICTGGGALSLALPSTSNVGDQINVVLLGSDSWTITQAAAQQIVIGSQQTSAGVAGSLTSTSQGDAVTLICSTTNLIWVVINSMGNPIVI